MRIPDVLAGGRPYDLGRQHGAAVPGLIRDVADSRSRLIAGTTGESLTAMARRSLRFLPLAAQHFPEHVEEIRGIADGAGLPFEVAFFLQVATEVLFDPADGQVGAEGCSAAAVAGPTGAIIGQNWDQPDTLADKQIILRLRPDDGPQILMFTHAGVIGYIGMNSEGLAQVSNQLLSPRRQPGVSHYFLKRAFLERATVEDCLQIVRRIPISSAANYVIADATGRIVDIEMAPEGFRVLDEGPRQVHANHFVHPDLVPLERYLPEIPDSTDRQHRLLVSGPRHASVEAFQAVFRDHTGYPTSICRHITAENPLGTAASIVMDLGARRMYVAPGPPCRTPYQTFDMR